MKKDDLEWRFEEPIVVKGEEENKFTVQCRECKDFILVPARPSCDACQTHMDVCRHGIACTRCSPKLILKWIQEGNLKRGDLPPEQLEDIKKLVQEKLGQEIYIDEEGFVRVR